MSYTITTYTLNKALNLFNTKVSLKQAKKMPYSLWRSLKQLADSNRLITVEKELRRIYTENDSSDSNINHRYILDIPLAFFDYIEEALKTTESIINKKENTTMKMSNMTFDFGPVAPNKIAMSPYGLAVHDSHGNWFTYKSSNEFDSQVVDVTGLTFDIGNMIYRIPAAISSIAEGDMIAHKDIPMYVTAINSDNSLTAIDIISAEEKVILPIRNPFGFSFVTKIVSAINFNNMAPSEDNPFGNIMPLMMASMIFEDEKSPIATNTSSGMDMGKLMMLSMMTGGENPFASMFNPSK